MPSREIATFIARWSAASATERAHSQLFLAELCDVLAVPRPDPQPDSGSAFEYPVTEHHPDSTTGQGHLDLYRRAHLASHRAPATLTAVPSRTSIPEPATRRGGIAARRGSSRGLA